MAAKHPNYYSTMRLGTSLRDQCSATDDERQTISNMLESLKNKWNMLRSIAAQRSDECLMIQIMIPSAVHSSLA